MTGAIGPFQFVSLVGNPTAFKQVLTVLERPGVAGVSIWRGGESAQPCKFVSMVDAANLYDGQSLFLQYAQLTASDPVSFTWAGLDMTGSNFLVQVLDVNQIELLYTYATAGLWPAGFKAILRCEWTLQPIRVA